MGTEEIDFLVINNDSIESMKQKDKNFLTKNQSEYGSLFLKLSRPVIIHSLQFTNSKSAFIEILVSNSLNLKFNVLVPVRLVLSLENSKSLKKYDRSIELKRDCFADNYRNKPVDYIQIICSQPFNKKITSFGISDIHIRVKDPKTYSKYQNISLRKFGIFNFLSNKELDKYTNLFDSFDIEYKKQLVRLYEKKPQIIKNENDQENTKNQIQDIKEKDNEGKKEKKADETAIKRHAKKEVENEEIKQDKGGSGNVKDKKRNFSYSDGIKVKKHVHGNVDEDEKEEHVRNKKKSKNIVKCDDNLKSKVSTSKSSILKGVVFVLSGYENPERSQLRELAVQMGAHYRSKWDEDCTHLICAFPDTPKFNDVQRLKGRIVTGKWILDCYKKGQLLQWKNYELKSGDIFSEKVILQRKETKDTNEKTTKVIDINENNDLSMDKDRKKKAVKRDRSDVKDGDGDDDENKNNDGIGHRKKRKSRREDDVQDEKQEKWNKERKSERAKLYAHEYDSDVIYDQDTEDELISDDCKQSMRS